MEGLNLFILLREKSISCQTVFQLQHLFQVELQWNTVPFRLLCINLYIVNPFLPSNLKPKPSHSACIKILVFNIGQQYMQWDTLSLPLSQSVQPKPTRCSFWTVSFQRPCWHFSLGPYPSSSSSSPVHTPAAQECGLHKSLISAAPPFFPTDRRSFPSLSLAAFAPGSLWPLAANEKGAWKP